MGDEVDPGVWGSGGLRSAGTRASGAEAASPVAWGASEERPASGVVAGGSGMGHEAVMSAASGRARAGVAAGVSGAGRGAATAAVEGGAGGTGTCSGAGVTGGLGVGVRLERRGAAGPADGEGGVGAGVPMHPFLFNTAEAQATANIHASYNAEAVVQAMCFASRGDSLIPGLCL